MGPPRPERHEPDTSLDLLIPSMLVGMWDAAIDGRLSPSFARDVRIKAGVLDYAQ